MPEYAVKTCFSFSGTFYIKARNEKEAKEYAEKHCGLVLNRGIHSTLPDDAVDWNFPMHPDKKINAVRVNKDKYKQAI